MGAEEGVVDDVEEGVDVETFAGDGEEIRHAGASPGIGRGRRGSGGGLAGCGEELDINILSSYID